MKVNWFNLIQAVIMLTAGFCLFMIGYTMPRKAIPIVDRETTATAERLPLPRAGLVRGINTTMWENGTVLVLGDKPGSLRAATAKELHHFDSIGMVIDSVITWHRFRYRIKLEEK